MCTDVRLPEITSNHLQYSVGMSVSASARAPMADDGILWSHGMNLRQGEGSWGEWDTQSCLHLDRSSMHEGRGERGRERARRGGENWKAEWEKCREAWGRKAERRVRLNWRGQALVRWCERDRDETLRQRFETALTAHSSFPRGAGSAPKKGGKEIITGYASLGTSPFLWKRESLHPALTTV